MANQMFHLPLHQRAIPKKNYGRITYPMNTQPDVSAASIFARLTQILPEDCELGRALSWAQLLQFFQLTCRIAPALYELSAEHLGENEEKFLAASLGLPKHLVADCWLRFRAVIYLLPTSIRSEDDDAFRRHGADHNIGLFLAAQRHNGLMDHLQGHTDCQINRPSAAMVDIWTRIP